VPDVEAFPGHIACSPLSRSEVVLPVRDTHGAVRAVFDIDSSTVEDFDAADVARLQGLLDAHSQRLIPEADA
ncbi:MAG: GAF domain-containing protein, partial [Bacteroidota bacterium]|nr:GAF domain-containing protein [Bacteroidota bacterium]